MNATAPRPVAVFRHQVAYRIGKIAKEIREPLQEFPDLGDVVRGNPHDERQPDQPHDGVPERKPGRLDPGPGNNVQW